MNLQLLFICKAYSTLDLQGPAWTHAEPSEQVFMDRKGKARLLLISLLLPSMFSSCLTQLCLFFNHLYSGVANVLWIVSWANKHGANHHDLPPSVETIWVLWFWVACKAPDKYCYCVLQVIWLNGLLPLYSVPELLVNLPSCGTALVHGWQELPSPLHSHSLGRVLGAPISMITSAGSSSSSSHLIPSGPDPQAWKFSPFWLAASGFGFHLPQFPCSEVP